MESKKFKLHFGNVAKANGFTLAHGCWYVESNECLVVLELQNSNFGAYFKLNIKVFIQGMFGLHNKKTKDELKKYSGTVFRNQPTTYNDVFGLSTSEVTEDKEAQIGLFFKDFLMPFVHLALTKEGIKELAQKGEIYLAPPIKELL